MERVAIFVDAGYLFAQGSTALAGSKRPRLDLVFNARTAVDELKKFAMTRAPTCSLLRIYWYDGAVAGTQPTSEQSQIAGLDDVKLRLGFINSAGQQKGVDSLIVTDLIELARQKAICDAILLSGDEDVRVGVQIAQNYGVRLHLLGIAPARGSQSHQLMQEADTTSVWDRNIVANFLSMRTPTRSPVLVPAKAAVAQNNTAATKGTTRVAKAVAAQAPREPQPAMDASVAAAVDTFVSSLEQSDLRAIEVFWQSNRGVPSDFDRKILAQCRDALQKELDAGEKKQMRSYFRDRVLSRISSDHRTAQQSGAPTLDSEEVLA